MVLENTETSAIGRRYAIDALRGEVSLDRHFPGRLRRDQQPVVTVVVLDMSESDLRAEVVRLRRRVRILTAVVGLLVAVLRVSDRRMPRIGFGDRTTRATLMRAASRARKVLPASAVLKIVGISSSRYTA